MSRFGKGAFDLSADRRALLASMLKEQGIDASIDSPITPRAEANDVPLSFGQERLWFLDQLAPGQPFYTIAAALRLRFALSVPALERALSEVVRRHEALRTTFSSGPEGALQVVHSPVPVRLPVDDLRVLSPLEREAEASRLATEEARLPFDLALGPLVRARLLCLADDDFVLLLTLHHIVADGWSMTLLVRELSVLYPAFVAGRGSPLGELPIQYADFAVWQRSRLEGDSLASLLAYWSGQLRDLPVLQLPTDRPRPAVQGFRGGTHRLVVDAGVVAGLRSVGQQEGATLFMTLLAGFAALLHRYGGQDDLAIGAPIAGRTRAETEELIGFFVNTLVLRVDAGGDPSFRELVRRVRAVALGAYAHQDLPFEMLVERLQPERDLSRNPLFQVTFQLLNIPGGSPLGTPSEGMSIDVERTASIVDLAVNLMEGPEGIAGHIEYDADLFDESTIARMVAHYQMLLHAVAADPDRLVSVAPLLSRDERRRLLEDWNATDADYPAGLCCHQLFEAQVERTPDATALVQEELLLTYRELNQRANELASYLRTLGVGRQSFVGVFLNRSVEMVVGLLGVLKAGGTYVPMDTAYPRDRLAFMLAETQASVVLTTSRLECDLPVSNAAAVCLDTDREPISRAGEEPSGDEATPDDLAYVIYTSGSTGAPKGVMVPHRGLVNYLSWCVNAYDVAGGQGAPVHSSIGFDLTITALFSPLVTGRSVHLLPEGDEVEGLAATLRRQRDFSLVKITPAHLELLGRQLGPGEAWGRARVLVIGGEALTSDHVSFWRQHAPETRLINEYGPTETVIGCCVHEVPAGELVEGAIPIGRPIANTQLYVLDRHLQPVPIGIPGELFIGGHGVARGYLNRPDLTAERFIPDPFSASPGARLYKTGDFARYRSDGVLEYLGRRDDQVKIRGYRIELGEVEAVLLRHPDVREAAVVVREDEARGKELAAYLVPRQDPATSVDELRRFLRDVLPDYMVPSTFAFLSTLPLTANGKVDRRALAVLDRVLPPPSPSHVAPRTETEEFLAQIWVDLLGVVGVGIHDNFFELGGHSLLATQVVSRLREKLQIELPVRMVFEAPTVADLALRIAQAEGEQGLAADLPIPRIGRTTGFEDLADPDQLSDSEVDAMLREATGSFGDELLAFQIDDERLE